MNDIRLKITKKTKSPISFEYRTFIFPFSWRKRNSSTKQLNINYLIFKILITTSEKYCFEYQVASICSGQLLFFATVTNANNPTSFEFPVKHTVSVFFFSGPYRKNAFSYREQGLFIRELYQAILLSLFEANCIIATVDSATGITCILAVDVNSSVVPFVAAVYADTIKDCFLVWAGSYWVS